MGLEQLMSRLATPLMRQLKEILRRPGIKDMLKEYFKNAMEAAGEYFKLKDGIEGALEDAITPTPTQVAHATNCLQSTGMSAEGAAAVVAGQLPSGKADVIVLLGILVGMGVVTWAAHNGYLEALVTEGPDESSGMAELN